MALYELRAVDTWRDLDGWYWNDSRVVQSSVEIPDLLDDDLLDDDLLAWLVKQGPSQDRVRWIFPTRIPRTCALYARHSPGRERLTRLGKLDKEMRP